MSQETLFEEDKSEQAPPVVVLDTRTCKHCQGDFKPGKKNQEYCSDNCRWNHHKKAKKAAQREGTTTDGDNAPRKQTHLVTKLEGINAQGQWIIGQQASQIEELKADLKRERDKREQAESKVAELKDDIKIREHKEALQGIMEENEKPSIMDQVLGFISQLPPAVQEKGGEMLLNGVQKLFNGVGNAVKGGVGNVDGQLDTMVQPIVDWYGTLTPENQNSVRAIFDQLQRIPNEQALKAKLAQMHSMAAGTPFTQPPKMNFGYGNFGS
jgi:hypothetical protein